MESKKNQVLVIDFGSQYSQLIVRKTRELGVYSELVSFVDASKIFEKKHPQAIILSGGPESVYEKDSPDVSDSILNSGVPILGVCYGMQLLSIKHGGKVIPGEKREFGRSRLHVKEDDKLLENAHESIAWMSHGDCVVDSGDLEIIASTEDCKYAAVRKDNIYGIQFHPEVHHTEKGKQILSNFLFSIARLKKSWNMEEFVETRINKIRETTKGERVICALSGGVDSSVMTVLLSKAIGHDLTAIFVDNGLLRKGEKEEVENFFKDFDFNLKIIDAQDMFLDRLAGVVDPEKKRKIIGNTFIEIFDEEAKKTNARFLAQGTLYPDVIESISYKGPSHTIKSHHNVGGLPKKMNLRLIEPFYHLFKDEVREVGRVLGLPRKIVGRHPFPGPGLAIRILSDVDREKLRILKDADYIMREEIEKAGVYNDIWQALCVLTPLKTVGVMGDKRTYENVLALRMVDSVDGMTADFIRLDWDILQRISARIVSEVRGINRVVYDITQKPPGTIEWE